MNTWFSNSWLLRGLRKSSNKPINTDNEEEYSYPREKQAKTVVKKETPFSGAMTSAAESWVLCQDRTGQRYWWNEVTGQWTYQLYNPQQSYMPQMMANNLMYAQQQQQQQHYSGGMVSSPQYLTQHPWLGSPSRESQTMHAGGAAGAWGWQQGGVYDDDEEDEEEEEEEEEEVVKGAWDKYYTYRNGGRQSLWIHSATGIRTTVDPTA